jgi:predicted GH43/DUF377 family glycosyl hydrolase
VLSPGAAERQGVVADVVFPTGWTSAPIWENRIELTFYFGMADDRIGAASIYLPPALALSKQASETAA